MAKDKGDSGEKTRKPTRWRLEEARREGNVPKSKDLTSAFQLAAWLVIGVLASPLVVSRACRLIDNALSAAAAPSATALIGVGTESAKVLIGGIVLLGVPVGLVGLITNFIQVGGVFALGTVSFRFGNLDPVEGIRKIFRTENLIELLKSIFKLSIVLAISYVVIKGAVGAMIGVAGAGPAASLAAFGDAEVRLLSPIVAAGFAVGILDLLYQRFAYLKRLRMSIREFREEKKRSDGDPRLKARRRRLFQTWVHHDAAQATQGATVVVTNPTHFAVALAYDPLEHDAPIVAAKGQDLLARHIRDTAEAAGVPIIENPPLARLLHSRVEIDETVPGDVFAAVAEVIVWAGRMRRSGVVGDG